MRNTTSKIFRQKNIKNTSLNLPEHSQEWKRFVWYLEKFLQFPLNISGNLELWFKNFCSFEGNWSYVKIPYLIRKRNSPHSCRTHMWLKENAALNSSNSSNGYVRLLQILFFNEWDETLDESEPIFSWPKRQQRTFN